MVLSMSRPWKHLDSGIYYVRKGVPDDLQAQVGTGAVYKRSLRTKDPNEAKRLHAIRAAQIDAEWADLRRRNAALSAPPLTELATATIKRAGEAYYVHLLEEDEEQRIDGFRTPDHTPYDPAPTFEEYAADGSEFEASARHDHARGEVDAFYLTEVDEVLSWDGFEVRLDPASPSRKLVARALQAASIRAAKAKKERNNGEPIETPAYPPPLQKPSAAGSLTAAQPLLTLFTDWWREAKATGRKPSTHDNYRNTMNMFIAFLGHDDAGKVTSNDVVRFKDHRLSTVNPRTGKPTSPKTVKDGDLAALKTVLGWGRDNHRLTINAAEGITIKLKKAKRSQSRAFTDDEAKALLAASDAYQGKPREKHKLVLAKRWVPWLCAYTGARVGEMIQLRKQDVRVEEGHYVIHINPEAGTVKTDEPRDVVLHTHLIERGFPDLLASSKEGYLFIDPATDRDVRGTLKSRRNDMVEFARETVKDPNVQPNHGWRHRFTKVWIEAGLPERTMDYIEGHAPVNVSRRSYSADNTVKAQAMYLARFPRQGGDLRFDVFPTLQS